MTDAVPSFAPGCFGSALAFDPTAPVCTVCKFKAQCETLHKTNMEALRERIGITVNRSKAKKSDRFSDIGMTPPKKAIELAAQIQEKGIKVTEAFREGRNPFDGVGMVMLRIIAHKLLKATGAVPRSEFSFACQKLLKWQPSTADAQIRIGIATLIHIGAVDVVDGAVSLRR